MNSVAIVTDSTADLPPDLARLRQITVVPLTLNFDGQSLLDGVDIRPDEFYRRLHSVTTHPTGQPSRESPAAGSWPETSAGENSDDDSPKRNTTP